MDKWIQHLQHPLVLAGFALFLFAGLFKLIKTEKITGKATASLFHKGMNYLFILALLILIAGFALSFYKTYLSQQALATKNTATPSPVQTQLTTTGEQSPAIQSGNNVNINYGGVLSEKSTTQQDVNTQAPLPPAKIKTEGKQSPAINTQGDVNINYEDN